MGLGRYFLYCPRFDRCDISWIDRLSLLRVSEVMGYLNRPLPPHRCNLEPPTMEIINTVWKCDECGQIWRVKQGEYGNFWKRASDRWVRRHSSEWKIH